MSEVWMEYCPECRKNTLHRYLDCEEHDNKCEMIVCCDCGCGEEAKDMIEPFKYTLYELEIERIVLKIELEVCDCGDLELLESAENV